MARKWNAYGVEPAVLEILQGVRGHEQSRALGRPYLTAYQLAVAFDQRYPAIAAELAREIATAGDDWIPTLAAYLARELAAAIAGGRLPGVQAALLSDRHLLAASFGRGGLPSAKVDSAGADFVLFRAV